MNPREKRIGIAAAVIGALALVYFFWYQPWEVKRADLLRKRETLRDQLAETNRVIAQEAVSRQRWAALDAALKEQAKADDVSLALIGEMIGLTQKAGMNLSVNNSHAADVTGGPVMVTSKGAKIPIFREHVLETKFDCTWEQFLDLLNAISNSDGLLRTRRLTIRSDYEKNPKLDIELRVTSVERKRS